MGKSLQSSEDSFKIETDNESISVSVVSYFLASGLEWGDFFVLGFGVWVCFGATMTMPAQFYGPREILTYLWEMIFLSGMQHLQELR